MASCSQCSAALKPNAKFCTNCGARGDAMSSVKKAAETCPSCKAAWRQNAKACVSCGFKPAALSSSSPPPPTPSSSSSSVSSVSPRATSRSSRVVVRCHKCQAKLKSASVVFCTKCGAKQPEKGGSSEKKQEPEKQPRQEQQQQTAGEGDSCSSCKAELKAGMSFCTKCGHKVGSKASSDRQRERRMQAARKAEKRLEEERAKMREEEQKQLDQLEKKTQEKEKKTQEKDKKTQEKRVCVKCNKPLKPKALFCTSCGTKCAPGAPAAAAAPPAKKKVVDMASLIGSLETSSNRLMSPEEMEEMKRADRAYADEVAKIRADHAAKIREKERQLVAELVAEDLAMSDNDGDDEDFVSQLRSLEEKANDAEEELMQAMKGIDAAAEAATIASSSRSTPKPTVQIKDVDPSKYGLASFESLFDNLSEEDNDNEKSTPMSLSSARQVISQGESIRTEIEGQRQKRQERQDLYSKVALDNLDKELADLMDLDNDDDHDLDDDDFALVGGKHVRRVVFDSDDESSSD